MKNQLKPGNIQTGLQLKWNRQMMQKHYHMQLGKKIVTHSYKIEIIKKKRKEKKRKKKEKERQTMKFLKPMSLKILAN